MWQIIKSVYCTTVLNGRDHGKKRNEPPNHVKAQSSFKVCDAVGLESMVGVEGSPLLWATSGKPNK